MAHKKLFLFGLIIFFSLLLFSFAGKVSAQCTCYGNDPNTGDEYSYDCACEGGSFTSGDNIGGCTDQSCDNYDASATYDDGTCWNCGTVGGGDCACDVTFGCDEGCACDAEIADCGGSGSSGGLCSPPDGYCDAEGGEDATNCPADCGGGATKCEIDWAGTCTSNCAPANNVGVFGCTGGEECCVFPSTGNKCETDWGGTCTSGCAAADNVGVFGCTGGKACCVPPVGSSKTFLDANGNPISGASRNAQGVIVDSNGNPILGATAVANAGGVTMNGNLATITFANPLQATSVNQFLVLVLGSLQGIIAILSVIFIVIGGIMYITSAGNETAITRAKNTITAALVGLAIALAAPSFLAEIMTILGSNVPGPAAPTLRLIALRTLSFLLSVVGIIGIIGLVIGGYSYVTAYGSEKKIDTAKTIVKYSLIGIVVALAAVILVRQVATILGVV